MAIFAKNLFTDSKDDTDNSLQAIKDAFIEVAINYSGTGNGKSFVVNLDKESAIVGFNPGSDFAYYSPDLDINPDPYFDLLRAYKGVEMKRPPEADKKCSKNEACICSCSVDYDDGKISGSSVLFGGDIPWPDKLLVCENADCVPLVYKTKFNDIMLKFPEKSLMLDVFEDKKRETASYASKDRSQHYWDNSIIILRTDLIEPLGIHDGVPIVVAGYRDFFPSKYVEVFIKKVSNNADGSKTVGICLKENCLPEQKTGNN